MNKLFLLLLLILAGCDSSTSLTKNKVQRVGEIKEEIEQLKRQIRSFEIQALNDEVQGQGAMRGNYGRFADELQSSERNEQHAQLLEKQLQALLKEQKELEKSL